MPHYERLQECIDLEQLDLPVDSQFTLMPQVENIQLMVEVGRIVLLIASLSFIEHNPFARRQM